ncbi:MAG: M13 family metallopeptidase [Bacteroidales bacterium]|nr:M13 family metallopeptidase [Bacteroidales bacterium]MCM1147992.1 M13 family metallopeptidase [Bacteroidales bacterium]MCM1206916.1 M13 family metallopeptidase [Bacillota bacterium]MCM1509550.1 M13 family metallopeptidase [Clostridium sp.]
MNIKNIMTIVAIAAMPAVSQAQTLGPGIKAENMNTAVAPGADFYEYSCGGWMKKNPLPAAYSRYGSFDQLAENNNKRINSILTELSAKKNVSGSLEQKIGDLYNLCMDSVRRNKEGVTPVMPYIKAIEKAKGKKGLMEILYAEAPYGVSFFAYCGFGADEKDSKNNILSVYQGGLTLGQKDYYVNKDEATLAIMEAYRKHIVNMFKLFGFKEKDAKEKMEKILSVENRIAQFSLSRTEMRDVEKNYNKMTLDEFRQKYPNYPIVELLQAEGIDKKYFKNLVVGQPAFMEGLNALLGSLDTEELRAVMEWNVIHDAASLVGDDVAAESFDFNGRVISGRQVDFPRWRKSTNLVQAVLGQPLGKIYCERYFPASSKERMKQLVANLQTALGERIDAQEWMTAETKKVAREKLATFYVKIGYPDKWKDFSGLTIDPAKSLYENLREASKFRNKQRNDETVGKPVDRDEWHMTPQTVNAYYNPTTNEICFPAGILQYPFFDADADDAFNYGAIGVVIGHEMTHGFDDQGSHFDKDGNMSDWWKPEDVANFKKLGDQYADFFSEIEVLPGVKSNGRMTLGENLADHGGLEVSFHAFKNANKDNTVKLGLTPEQRFFVAYAGVWGQNITEKEIRNRLLNDVHSQGEWRVKGALPHIDAWYDAFNIQPSDKLYLAPEKRLKLW